MELSMDRPRAITNQRKVWPIVAAFAVVASGAVLLASLRSAAPSVERSSAVIDVVRRGPFLREVAAPGILVADQSRLIAAPAAGRVDVLHVDSGESVDNGAPIVTLTNRQLVKELLEIEQQLATAEADAADLAATLQARSLESEKTLHRAAFEQRDTARQAEASSQLAAQGLISNLEAVRARETSEESAQRAATEQQRHRALARSAAAQMEAQRNRIERLRAVQAFQRSVVDALVVRTPAAGAVREIAVQPGEWVTEGQRLARLVEPGRLKAVLQVPEATALDVKSGQVVTMNARGTALRGVVERTGAAVEQGAVPVEVRLEGELSPLLRPDLSIDGRIEISRLADALSITRPVQATAGTTGQVYRLDADGRTARRVAVHYGAASVDRIVITGGAAAGDRLIVGGVESSEDAVVRLH
jgi:multidrug efflux pump subunit AcrA (membrane-fusion protein)